MKTTFAAAFLICTLGATAAQAADVPRPDFSGVWTWNREAGAGRGSTDINQAWPKEPPFTAEAKAKTTEYRALVTPQGLTPGGACVGSGMPASMLGSGGYPMEWIQRPEQITVIYEAHNEVRRIYINSPPPNANDVIPSRNGTSLGRWEADTLIVETFGLKEAVDQTSAHSDQAKIVERYRMGKDDKGRKVLTAEMTMTDPVFYTRPISVTKKWLAVENGRLLPYECTEPQWEDQLEKLRQEARADDPASKKP